MPIFSILLSDGNKSPPNHNVNTNLSKRLRSGPRTHLCWSIFTSTSALGHEAHAAADAILAAACMYRLCKTIISHERINESGDRPLSYREPKDTEAERRRKAINQGGQTMQISQRRENNRREDSLWVRSGLDVV